MLGRQGNPQWALTLYGFCGMSIPMGEGGYAELRGKAGRVVRYYAAKQGAEVTVLREGRVWELVPPDDAGSVPDWAGTLHLERAQ